MSQHERALSDSSLWGVKVVTCYDIMFQQFGTVIATKQLCMMCYCCLFQQPLEGGLKPVLQQIQVGWAFNGIHSSICELFDLFFQLQSSIYEEENVWVNIVERYYKLPSVLTYCNVCKIFKKQQFYQNNRIGLIYICCYCIT